MSLSPSPVIAHSVSSQRHRVRLTHASTGEPIRGVRLAPLAWPAGWFARVEDGDIFIGARDGVSLATVPFVDVVITDGVLLQHLKLPPLLEGQPPDSVRVPLTGSTVTRSVPPTDMILTVALTVEAAGGPSTGKVVTVHPTSGAPVALPETATPGTYTSSQRSWGAAFTGADLLIGTTSVRKVSLDFTRSHTRIYVVDPT